MTSVYFQLQGIPFGFLCLVGLIQIGFLCQRMKREKPPLGRRRAAEEWDIWFGRVGMLILLVGTFLDNFRKFSSAFSFCWPAGMDNSLITEQVLAGTLQHHGVNLQRNLYWICRFGHVVLTPLGIYSTLRILHNQVTSHKKHTVVWFVISTAFILSLVFLGLYNFFEGPWSGPLEIRHHMGIRVFHASRPCPILKGILGVIMWQLLLLLLAATLRQENSLWVVINLGSLLVQSLNPKMEHGWAPAWINLTEQLVIGTQVWMDAVHSGTPSPASSEESTRRKES